VVQIEAKKSYGSTSKQMLIKQIKLLKKQQDYSESIYIFLICFLLQAVGKMDPTLEDYLQPSPVRELKLSALLIKLWFHGVILKK